MSLNVSVSNDAFLRSLNVRVKQINLAARRALYQMAEEIMADSKINYVPVDTGALRASGHVQQPVVNGGRITVTFGFGGTSAKYAVHVHERIYSKNFNLIHHPVGQAKYLEAPLNKRRYAMSTRLATLLRADLR